MAHSPEYEREVISTLRLVRLVIQLGLLLIGLMLVAGILGFAVSFATVRGASSGQVHSVGQDLHAPLRAGSSINLTTEAGLKASAAITNVTWAQGPVVTARITSAAGAAVRLDNWLLYLDDNTRLQMTGQSLGNNEYRFALDGTIPAGKSVRFVHFNPDESHGDIYFDVN